MNRLLLPSITEQSPIQHSLNLGFIGRNVRINSHPRSKKCGEKNKQMICRKATPLKQMHLWTINNAKPTDNTHYFKSSDGGAIFTVEILACTSFQLNVFEMFIREDFPLSAPSCAWSLPCVYSFWSAQDVFPVWWMYSILRWINWCTVIVDRWPLKS